MKDFRPQRIAQRILPSLAGDAISLPSYSGRVACGGQWQRRLRQMSRPLCGRQELLAAAVGLLLASFLIWLGSPSASDTTEFGDTVALTVPTPTVHNVSIGLYNVQKIELLFNSPADLRDARISIDLPPHVDLAGFPGERTISWTENIRQGNNVLALPLTAHQLSQGQLVARIEHDGKTKSLYIQVIVTTTTPAGSRQSGLAV